MPTFSPSHPNPHEYPLLEEGRHPKKLPPCNGKSNANIDGIIVASSNKLGNFVVALLELWEGHKEDSCGKACETAGGSKPEERVLWDVHGVGCGECGGLLELNIDTGRTSIISFVKFP